MPPSAIWVDVSEPLEPPSVDDEASPPSFCNFLEAFYNYFRSFTKRVNLLSTELLDPNNRGLFFGTSKQLRNLLVLLFFSLSKKVLAFTL